MTDKLRNEIGTGKMGGDRLRDEITTTEDKENGITNFLDKNKFPTREIWADNFTDEKMKELSDTLNTLPDKEKIEFGKSIHFVSGGNFEKEFRKLIPEDEEERKLNERVKEQMYDDKISKLRSEIYSLFLRKQRGEATELIVKEFLEKNYIKVTRDDKNPEFYIYKEGIYISEGKTYIEEFVRKVLKNTYSTQLLNDVVNKISADNKIDFDEFMKDKYPNKIAIKNGILNLNDNTLEEFSPDKIFFTKLPIKYDANIKCNKILSFLKEILQSDEDVNLLLELFGYSLVKDNFLEVAFMFVGGGRNGKGKLLELFKRFLGIENTCSVRLQEMNTQSSSICELYNKHVNLAGDLSNQSFKDTGLFKEITGRDTIQAKRKYLRDLKFVNYSKQIFACNELPRVYDNSSGFWNRWVLINFIYEFVDKKHYDKLNEKDRKFKKIKNPNIINEITSGKELSGLLNLALEGLKRIRKNKSLTYSQNAEEVKREWVRKADSFVAFCMDNIEEDYDSKVLKKDLKKEYNKYRKKFKLKNSSDISIKITLEEKFGVSEGQNKSTGDRFWEGIRLKKDKVTGVTYLSQNPSKLNFLDFPENHVTPVTFNKNKENTIKIRNYLKKNQEKSRNNKDLEEKFPNIKNIDEILEILRIEGIIFQPKLNEWRYLE